jgi:hypothetical protein
MENTQRTLGVNLSGLNFSWIFVVWRMAPLAPVVVTISGATIHPLLHISFNRGAYLISFSAIF